MDRLDLGGGTPYIDGLFSSFLINVFVVVYQYCLGNCFDDGINIGTKIVPRYL